MVKFLQEKPANGLRIDLSGHTFYYIAARLGIKPEELAWSLGYQEPKKWKGWPLSGPRALAFVYFCALHGYDYRDLLLEAEEAIDIRQAVSKVGFNYKATLLSLRMIGIEPLTKGNPTYIRRSDLALLLSPSLGPLRDIFNANPIRLWRKENKYRMYYAAALMDIDSQRLTAIEAGHGELARLYEMNSMNRVIGRGTSDKYEEWYQTLRAARYALAALSDQK